MSWGLLFSSVGWDWDMEGDSCLYEQQDKPLENCSNKIRKNLGPEMTPGVKPSCQPGWLFPEMFCETKIRLWFKCLYSSTVDSSLIHTPSKPAPPSFSSSLTVITYHLQVFRIRCWIYLQNRYKIWLLNAYSHCLNYLHLLPGLLQQSPDWSVFNPFFITKSIFKLAAGVFWNMSNHVTLMLSSLQCLLPYCEWKTASLRQPIWYALLLSLCAHFPSLLPLLVPLQQF